MVNPSAKIPNRSFPNLDYSKGLVTRLNLFFPLNFPLSSCDPIANFAIFSIKLVPVRIINKRIRDEVERKLRSRRRIKNCWVEKNRSKCIRAELEFESLDIPFSIQVIAKVKAA